MWISVIWLSVFEDSNVFTIFPDISDFCIYLPTWPHSLANCETGCLLFICHFISLDAPMLFWRWQWLHTRSRSRGHKFIAHSRKTFDYDVPSAVYYILHINYIYSVFIVANKFPQMLASTMFHDVFIYFSASSLSTCVQRETAVFLMYTCSFLSRHLYVVMQVFQSWKE